MNNLQLLNLKNELSEENSDYWSDEGCNKAREYFDLGGAALINEIDMVWREWPENMQEHLAYILGEGSSKEEVNLVYDLLDSQYQSVVYRAKEIIKLLENET